MLRSFKYYEPEFVHVDLKYVRQVPHECARRHLFVAVDPATRCFHVEILRT